MKQLIAPTPGGEAEREVEKFHRESLMRLNQARERVVPPPVATELWKPQPGDERLLVSVNTEDMMKMQLALDKLQRVAWLRDLCPWEVMATFTFRWEASCWSAMKSYVGTMRRRLPFVSYYACTEQNPSRDGYHVHSLWADCRDVSRRGEWEHWFNRYGRARIEPVLVPEDASGYASKYLTKEESHVAIKVSWKHKARINGWTTSSEKRVSHGQGAGEGRQGRAVPVR